MYEIFVGILSGIFSSATSFILEKFLGRKKESTVLNFYFYSGKLIKLIEAEGIEQQIRDAYQTLFNWIKSSKGDKHIEYLGPGMAKKFIKYRNKLKKPESATLREMLLLFDQIEKGKINLALGHKIGTTTIQEIIKNAKSEVQDKLFSEIAYNTAMINCKDIREIRLRNYPKLNVGGSVAFLRTNAQFSNVEVIQPEILGFSRIKDHEALVNLVISKKLTLEEVLLKNIGDKYYSVELVVRNDWSSPISFKIPKGQIFENKDYDDNYQNLASVDETIYTILPNETERYFISTLCLNQPLPPPSDHGTKGNIAIFEVGDKSFRDQSELWEILENNKDKLRYSKR